MIPARSAPVGPPPRWRASLREAFAGVRERRWLVLGLALLLAALGASLALVLPARHRGQALVRVEWADPGATADVGEPRRDRRRELLRGGLLEGSRLERLFEETAAVWPLASTNGRKGLVMSRVDIEPRRNGVFSVSFTDTDPALAVLVPNRLTEMLIEAGAGGEAPETARLTARLLEAREEVEARENDVLEVRERELGPGPDRQVPAATELRGERRRLGAELAAAEGQASGLRQAMEDAPRSPASLPAGPPTELDRLRAQLADLRERYTERHPDVEAVRRRIEKLEVRDPEPGATTAADPASSAELAELEGRVEELRERVARLDERIAAAEASSTRPRRRRGLTLAEAESRLEQARAEYAALRRQREATQTASRPGTDGVRVSLLAPADGALPVAHSPLLLALLGAALGLMLGVPAAVLAEKRDDRVRGPEDVEELLGKPLLASLPEEVTRSWWSRLLRRGRPA